jgi:hypothetical protein
MVRVFTDYTQRYLNLHRVQKCRAIYIYMYMYIWYTEESKAEIWVPIIQAISNGTQ